MDKVTRVLMLYAKLARGEVIDKAGFCFETECRPRSFDRDIEDVRLFLSEASHAGELVYDRGKGGYLLTESAKRPLEDTEYRLLEKVMLGSRVMRRDEMDEILRHVALHAEHAKRAAEQERRAMGGYAGPEHGKPLLKMFEDLNRAIDGRQVIRLHGDALGPDSRNAVPYAMCYRDGRIWLLASAAGTEELLRIPLEEIEAFSVVRNQSAEEKRQAECYIKKESGGT